MALQRRTVRRLFITVLLLLPFQYALVGLIGLQWSEPWPALVMPGFQQVYDPARITTDVTTVDVVFAEGSRRTLQPADLLADLPRSHHDAVLREHFRPTGTDEPAHAQHPASATWLRQRLATLAPDRPAARVEVVRQRLAFQPNEGTPLTTLAPLDTLIIPLR